MIGLVFMLSYVQQDGLDHRTVIGMILHSFIFLSYKRNECHTIVNHIEYEFDITVRHTRMLASRSSCSYTGLKQRLCKQKLKSAKHKN